MVVNLTSTYRTSRVYEDSWGSPECTTNDCTLSLLRNLGYPFLTSTTMAPRVFLITGCSTGFGEELVKVALQKGDYVVATARNSSKLSFDGANDSNSLLVDLDVTKKESIDKAFDAAIKKFKRVDVVVNNAGYGLSGPFETLSEKQIRQQMEINFFGLIDVTRKAMETMRDLKTGGVIQQVTSIGGQIGQYATSSEVLWLMDSRCPQLFHLLCQQMGSRGFYRSHLERGEA